MTAGRSATEDDGGRFEDAGDRASERPEERPLPPGPDGYPLVGNTLDLIRDPFGFYDDLEAHGDVVRYEVAGRTFVALLHPEHVERVLLAEHDRFERYLGDDLGLEFAPEGLLFTEGDQWRAQREVLQPAFRVDRIRTYGEAMVDDAEETAGEWRDGQAVVLNEAYAALTLRILGRALLGLEVDPSADDEPIVRGARAINDLAGPGRNLAALLPSWLPTPGTRRFERAMTAYRERVTELIERRRREGATGDDLLSTLLRAERDGERLSTAEIRDNVIAFTFAGHETTALGLTYATMLLATHDDVASRLRAELETVLGGERPTAADVPRLEYTRRVVKEAMRRYPPAFILFRRAREDAEIGGYRIPEGALLTVPQFRLHADERFYDDPEAFRPERWTDEMEADLPEYAYFPFGGGPRHCIGMRFATLELTLVLATLCQSFEFTLLSDPDPELSAGATLRPKEDVRVRVHRRD